MNNMTSTTTDFNVVSSTKIDNRQKSTTDSIYLKETDYLRKFLTKKNIANRPTFSPNSAFSETGEYAEKLALSQMHLDLSLQNTKQYNREIVRRTILSSYDKIVAERRDLVERKFNSGLSLSEEKKLNYLDWQLDRIDDARGGDYLDKLELIVQAHEQLAQKVGVIVEDMKNVLPQSSKRKKRRKKS